ncbi:MAG: hypothetical protein WCC58_07580, partial [Burkholderiales bacterium]
MNAFDSVIISFLNSFSRKSWAFDQIVNLFANTVLLKGGVLVTVLWWAWFADSKDKAATTNNRNHVLTTLLACFVALFIGRVMALTLPFRSRPIHNPDIVFLPPYGVLPSELD